MKKLNQDLKNEATLFATKYSNSEYNFDFSENSLKCLDDLIEGQRQEAIQTEFSEISEDLNSLLFLSAFYLGEVIKQTVPGKWIEKDSEVFLKLDNGFIVNPVGKVFKRFYEGSEESTHGLFVAFTNKRIIDNIRRLGKIAPGTPVEITLHH